MLAVSLFDAMLAVSLFVPGQQSDPGQEDGRKSREQDDSRRGREAPVQPQ